MLSEYDKQRIRAEEIYRQEVIRQLAHYDAPQSKTVKFLNSPFGVWMLSSIFLAGFLSATNAIKSHVHEHEATKQSEQALCYEIRARTADFLTSCTWAADYKAYLSAHEDFHQSHSRLKQFKDSSMDDLIRQLGKLPPKEDQTLANAVSASLNKVYAVIQTIPQDRKLTDDEHRNINATLRKIIENDIQTPLYARYLAK